MLGVEKAPAVACPKGTGSDVFCDDDDGDFRVEPSIRGEPRGGDAMRHCLDPPEADGYAYSVLLAECVRADDDVGWRDATSVLTLLALRLECPPQSHNRVTTVGCSPSDLIEFERRAREFLTPRGVRALDDVRTHDLAVAARRRKQQQQQEEAQQQTSPRQGSREPRTRPQ